MLFTNWKLLPAGRAMCMTAFAPTVLGLIALMVIKMFCWLKISGGIVEEFRVIIGPTSKI